MRAYDAAPAAYDAVGEDDPAWRARYRSMLASRASGRRVLDVGCGAGRDAAAFEEMGFDVTGVDGSPGMLDLARQRCGGTFVHGDVRDLRPVTGTFDAAWSMFCVVHLAPDELVGTFQAWHRILEPEGVLVVSGAQSRAMTERTVDNWLNVPNNRCTFYYHPAHRLEEALDAGGFSVECVHPDTPAPYRAPAYAALGLTAYVVVARATSQK